MSKADLSLRLLAILRFTIPSNSSRTLNATEAYDVTSSGITLASAIGKLLDKDVAVKADAALSPNVGVGLTVNTACANGGGFGAEKAAAGAGIGASSTATASVWLESLEPAALGKKQSANNNNILRQQAPRCGDTPPHCTINFTGAVSGKEAPIGHSKNSKATNPNTIFYGGIPVGTGDYKKWQGKYAVLKINTSTGKCVLRIYDA